VTGRYFARAVVLPLIACIGLTVDGRDAGAGRMAAAARVTVGGETGVLIDDYAADAPIVRSAVTRK
jgi:hypothetical protein